MSRKIFISILGIGYYKQTKYQFDFPKNNSNKTTNFVQESTLLQLANDWTNDDKCFVFLTEKSRIDNWSSPAQINNKFVKKGDAESYIGLKEVLENNQFNFELIDIDIPDGNSEDEIWRIFEIVYNAIEDGDELYFDVTHAFRSIPMLVMVLINYAKLLKNITIESITYGNFMAAKNGVAPVDNLTSFSELQDWTNAANLFVNHGNLDGLVGLTKTQIAPLAKKAKGSNESVSAIGKLSTQLERVSLQMKTNRLPDIISGDTFARIHTNFAEIKEDIISPLTPILGLVDDKLSNFDTSKNILNGFKAVEFCLNSGLIQQAITMLQETIITISLEQEKFDIKNHYNRNLATSVFKILKNKIERKEWKGVAVANLSKTEILLEGKLFNRLKSIMDSLSDKRNDINHAGYSLKPLSDKVLRKLNSDVRALLERALEKIHDS